MLEREIAQAQADKAKAELRLAQLRQQWSLDPEKGIDTVKFDEAGRHEDAAKTAIAKAEQTIKARTISLAKLQKTPTPTALVPPKATKETTLPPHVRRERAEDRVALAQRKLAEAQAELTAAQQAEAKAQTDTHNAELGRGASGTSVFE